MRSPLDPVLPTGPGDHQRWDGLYGSARSLAISQAVRQHPALVLLVVADSSAAEQLGSELEFFLGQDPRFPVAYFPDWETLPYDVFSPHPFITSQRMETLYRLPTMDRGVIVVPVSTLMTRLAPRHYVDSRALVLNRGEQLQLEHFRQRLDSAGYRCVGQVMEHGEFAVRGALLDLYPMGARQPYRIDLFDDEIESIRGFEPESQRSLETIEQLRLLPAREFPLDTAAISNFRQQWRVRFEGDPNRCPIYRDVSQGLAPAGIEFYLGLFFDDLHGLCDYLPAGTLVIETGNLHTTAESFWKEVNERYELGRHDLERPLLPATEVFLQTAQLHSALNALPQISLRRFQDTDSGVTRYASQAPLQLPVDARASEPLAQVRNFLEHLDGRALFVAESAGRRETLLETFSGHGLRPRVVESWSEFLDQHADICMCTAPIERGARLLSPAIAIIAESQLFGERVAQRRRRGTGRDPEAIIRNLTELQEGAPVVHETHGIGRYRGLQTLDAGTVSGEYLCIEYADQDKLYIPVASLHLVSRYTGADPEHAPLHRLGSQQWLKARRKAAEQAFDVAAELLDIQARRVARPGISFTLEAQAYSQFEQGFPFEVTPDQLQSIESVVADMQSDRAMDRLVCGDVGFGKTEVAMRAAFIAVQAGYQVAILVPTTLLAGQHYQTFQDRFADWPVRIEQLSRFRSRKERNTVLEALADGRLDIVIGTHQLLQPEIRFKRLGLVIIDEEHRFGVRQKERLKSLRAETDILTLTATPIPRTLNFALSGLRDLSLMATPPARRLSIKTFVREWNSVLIREAVLREIRRGGQVYFVHNKVKNIHQIARELEALVPDARIEIAHGQMPERELERVMSDFYHRRFHVLLCTTIIETGIDVPSANTMIINRADRFGLAQLHQLRGRVGRSHHRAYAYLIVPQRKAMTADAVKRLEAIESLEELGIGFTLATHDLEIRGAGEILGEGQSGQIQEVGYTLYTRMLERAVSDLKAGRSPRLDRPLDHGTEIDLRSPALIPQDYLGDVHMRLMMYKRIASAQDRDQLDDIMSEMIDRFGILPDSTRTLFQITALKLRATPLGIRKIDLGPNGGRMEFNHDAQVDPASIVMLVQGNPGTYRMDGPSKLRLALDLPELADRMQALNRVLDDLGLREAA